MHTEKRKQAIHLRGEGKSYNEIQRLTNLSKSTLSLWLRDVAVSKKIKESNITKAKKTWANNITKFNKARAAKARAHSDFIKQKSSSEISKISHDELKLLGAALYWAEGYKRTKWNPHFCNSDPIMIKLMMKFFREICKVPEDRFRPQVQTHPNVSIEDAENYWSKISGIARIYFRKPMIKLTNSSKQIRPINRLPYGTFRIGIAHVQSFNMIMGWIHGLMSQFEQTAP